MKPWDPQDDEHDDDRDDDVTFAVTVVRTEELQWQVREYDDPLDSIDDATAAVRALRAPGPAFALVCVEDDYFVIVRPTPRDTRVFISDAAAAVEDDYAASALEEMGADIPEDVADDESWPDGDFDILADLGLSEEVLGVIVSDEDAWASELVLRVAEELGFDEELGTAVDVDF
ncbi:tRNA adenosine deaminase-associated protein [Corynebacterium uberis]|uniref:tRNA adenosine deaminase-associated protein n=1 Tax=Corynebacterium TaxID=1716 RepID=UPI001D09C971|nr:MULTISPECIES: tRNA adenosine deaminase-associated protein [Corynebacterium]MCZ9309894.1 tRNA adenosine deaminase-associated protein [Corynebacterium sp. c6VSa_13]UDL73183.1 tRNA adenosine deaminase-associated protein [Corynebacterium uberis]UDL75940.1 tRNA adenosine deaminase-associated protein [Corynebacterium uberis]UDL78152.1 tRNA adenosine deaminase-associated protein [Corynebacterium uberis]UDL80435.1 tRNA adenosine deaminase-associated protein [Corynebacterium uberis]